MTFTVTYYPNGATSGTVPEDEHYDNSTQVTVHGNEGNLIKNGVAFAYWTTAADGSGTVYNEGDQFTITANTYLYAQWYITDGLAGDAKTVHYAFYYHPALKKTAANPTGPEPDRNKVMASCDDDFDIMEEWFFGIALLVQQILVNITNQYGGATWDGHVVYVKTVDDKGNIDEYGCRTRIVAEVTEMFMQAQHKGWFSPDDTVEQSCGEGLSQVLSQELQVRLSQQVPSVHPTSQPVWLAWLNTSLPTSVNGSTQLSAEPSPLTKLSDPIDNAVMSFTVASAQPIPFATTYIIQIDNEQMLVTAVSAETNTLTVTRGYNNTMAAAHAAQTDVRLNYGSRADYVNLTLEHDLSPQPVGCAMLFIYYLRDQLGFSLEEIIAHAPGIENASTFLRGVYRNLTGDDSDPFPLFKQLLDSVYPPNQVSTLANPNTASPWPIGRVSFGLEKTTFGKDEIDGALQLSTVAKYPAAFYVYVDGLPGDALNITTETFKKKPYNPSPSISFNPALKNVDWEATECHADDEDDLNIR